MRDEYDIKNLNPRKNPYVKKQVTINLDESVIIYFKDKAEKTGIPYQILINLYLKDCVSNERNPEIIWK
ncbi:MAG: BrnA antitoxin family protein [Lachnospiraceae bacterium]|nr:BrnA antitoxin family protein [Lachnospiraceae bacterium]MDY6221291.1 BrnA antitoxin family protein [Candidatus Alectryocaccobium sp.]